LIAKTEAHWKQRFADADKGGAVADAVHEMRREAPVVRADECARQPV